jgi:hypothetical protein
VVLSRIDWCEGILAVGFLDEDRIIVGSHPAYSTSRSSTRCSGTRQPRIAKDWYVPASGAASHQGRGRHPSSTATEMHQAGGQTTLEYWILAEDLDELNATIIGLIHVVAEFR